VTLLGWPLARIALAFGGAAVVVGLLYVLRLRRRRVEVPFGQLWQRILRTSEATSLWQKIQRILSLLLQLALLALLFLALGDPTLGAEAGSRRSVVVLLDASASMQTREAGGRQRFDQAKDAALQVLRGLGDADEAMVLAMSARSTVLCPFSTDPQALEQAVQAAQPTDAPADLPRALQAAADALLGRPRPEIVLISDGAYPAATLASIRLSDTDDVTPSAASSPASVVAPEPASAPTGAGLGEVDLRGIDLRYVGVGQAKDNVGIVAFSARRYPRQTDAYEVFLDVASYRDQPSDVALTITAGNVPVDAETLHLPARGTVTRIYPDLAGAAPDLVARLSPLPPAGTSTAPGGASADAPPLDAFPVDDVAYALLPPHARERVLLVTPGDLYTEGALLLDQDNVDMAKKTPSEYDALAAAGRPLPYDAVVFDGVTPAVLPDVPGVLLLGASGATSPFPIAGSLDSPIVDDVRRDHPVMRWIELQDANFSRSAILRPEAGDIVLASAQGQPVIVARDQRRQKVVATGFDPRQSDLVLRVAYPLFLVNCIDWFAGDPSNLAATYATGETLRVAVPTGVPDGTELPVTAPDGSLGQAPVREGLALVNGEHAGFYTLSLAGVADSPPVMVAASLASPAESDITPAATLQVGPAATALASPTPSPPHDRRPIWTLLLLGACGLLLLEWLSYHRRWTV
jgi:hypothetical protein